MTPLRPRTGRPQQAPTRRRAVLLVIGLVSALADSDPYAAQAYLHDATARQQAVTLSVVSTDPYANPDTYHRTQVEPETSSFGSTIVSAFQAGRSFEWGASNLGWSVSIDAGATWTDGFLPGTTVHATPPGRWERVVDPSVAYDAKHDHWLMEGLGTRNLTGHRDRLFVSVSTDGAQTFGEPMIVARADRSQIFDKNWITCDNSPTSPYYGNCYSAWDDDGHNLRLHAATSVDGGLTWTAASTPRRSRAFGVQPVVQSSGTVVMPTGCFPCFGSFVSTDGGSTYRGPFAMPRINSRKVHGGLRMPLGLPSVDVDAAGTVYAVWHDCRFRHLGAGRHCLHNDIVMSTSTNGRRWSSVARIPIDPRTGTVALAETRTRWTDPLRQVSDDQGQFSECVGQTEGWTDIGP